eukprot:984713-Rhodomonas_salina.1
MKLCRQPRGSANNDTVRLVYHVLRDSTVGLYQEEVQLVPGRVYSALKTISSTMYLYDCSSLFGTRTAGETLRYFHGVAAIPETDCDYLVASFKLPRPWLHQLHRCPASPHTAHSDKCCVSFFSLGVALRSAGGGVVRGPVTQEYFGSAVMMAVVLVMSR